MKERTTKLEHYHFILIYSIAIVLASVSSLIISSSITSGTNLYIFMLFLLPQIFYLSVASLFLYLSNVNFSLLKKDNVKLANYGTAIILALGVFFVALLPNYYVQMLFEKLHIAATVILPTFSSFSDYFFGILLICILPAIGEEFIFRKVLCDSLSGIGEWKIIILSGAIFSLTHFNIAQTLYQFFIGCVLAYLYLKTKNITLTILIHFINNALALFITSITGAAMWNNTITLAISCGIGALLLVISLFFIKKSNPPLQKGKAKITMITYVFLFIISALWVVNAIASF